MLETEWEFYENNRDELVEKYCYKIEVMGGELEIIARFPDGNVKISNFSQI